MKGPSRPFPSSGATREEGKQFFPACSIRAPANGPAWRVRPVDSWGGTPGLFTSPVFVLKRFVRATENTFGTRGPPQFRLPRFPYLPTLMDSSPPLDGRSGRGLSTAGPHALDRSWYEERSRSYERQIESAEARGATGEAVRLRFAYEEHLESQRSWQDLELMLPPDRIVEWGFSLFPESEQARIERLMQSTADACHSSPMQWTSVGLARLLSGDYEPAVAAFRRVVQLAPDLPSGHHHLALALARAGRLEEALRTLESGVDSVSGIAASHHARGCLLLDLGRPRDSLVSFARAIELEPVRASSHCLRGEAFERLGRFTEALAAYRRATRLEPGLGEAHFRRGRLLRTIGRAEEALDAYEWALTGGGPRARGSLLREGARHDGQLAEVGGTDSPPAPPGRDERVPSLRLPSAGRRRGGDLLSPDLG